MDRHMLMMFSSWLSQLQLAKVGGFLLHSVYQQDLKNVRRRKRQKERNIDKYGGETGEI